MSVNPLTTPANANPLDVCEEFSRRAVNTENCRTSLVAATGTQFPGPLVTLMLSYLPPAPTTRNWETQWTGLVGREVILFALDQARTSLSGEELETDHTVTGKQKAHQFKMKREKSCLDVINGYLVKDNLYGAEQIERAAGDPGIEKFPTEEQIQEYRRIGRAKILGYCPNYNPDYQLPIDIDDRMQQPLRDRFTHPEALKRVPAHVTRMTHLIGLYLKPQGMSGDIAALIFPGVQFDPDSWQEAVQEHGSTATRTTEWRWFAEYLLGRSKSWENQLALIPPGLEPSDYTDSYCVFAHRACTGTWLLNWDHMRIQQVCGRSRLALGGAGARGLGVYAGIYDEDRIAVVPCGSS